MLPLDCPGGISTAVDQRANASARVVFSFLCGAVIAIAVRNVSGRRRWSELDEWPRAGGTLPIDEFIERGLIY